MFILTGVYLDSASICTSPPISSCPAGADKSHDCENMPLSLNSYNGKIYKNEHCLRCTENSQAVSLPFHIPNEPIEASCLGY